MRLHESHDDGGFGVSNNTITRLAASYTTNARFVAFLGTFACPAQQLFWKPVSWLGTIRPTTANERLGIGVQCFPPSSPFAKCGCKKHALDLYGDHTSTCTAHSGATKAHDWMVSVLGPLFRTAGHVVRTQRGVTASAGQRRGDVEIRHYLRDQAGSRSLVFDLSIAHDRFVSSSHVQQNGLLTHPQDLDGPLRVAAQRRSMLIGNNTLTIRTFLFSPLSRATPHACTTSFCVLFFYRPT
jgi:hypothetical protein